MTDITTALLGGSKGQVLTKRSDADLDFVWAGPTSSGTPAIPVALLPFAPTSPWRVSLSTAAVFEPLGGPKTAALLANPNPPDLWVNSGNNSHTIVIASASDPLVPVTDTNDSSRSRTYRIPVSARPSPGSDAHMHVLDPDGFTLHEAWGMNINNGYTAGRLATVDLRGSGIGPQNGVRAYGGSAIGGLVRDWEVNPGNPNFRSDPRHPGMVVPILNHPLAVAVRPGQAYYDAANSSGYGYYSDQVGTTAPGWYKTTPRAGFGRAAGYVWPASEEDYAAPNNYSGAVPMGTLFAIPGRVPMPPGLGSAGMAVFHALQDYGAYVVDTAGALVLYVENTSDNSPTEAFANELRGAPRWDSGPWRTLLNLCRVVTSNNVASPGGGALRRA